MIASNLPSAIQAGQALFEPRLLAYSVKTSAEGWQIVAWNIAKANRQFILHGYKKTHQPFVEELAVAYGYHLEMLQRKVIFVPQKLIRL